MRDTGIDLQFTTRRAPRSEHVHLATTLALRIATACVAFFALASAGCTRPATQLVVVVSSDLSVPADVVSVRAHVRPLDAPSEAGGVRTFALDGEGTLELPFSFGAVPPGGDPTRRVEISVDALDATEAVVVTRLVRTGFLPGQALRLPVFLAAGCRGRVCGPDLVCDRGECVSPDLPPESLSPVRPGAELLDAGPAADVGAIDAGAAGSCTPVPTRPWLTLAGRTLASDLVWRDGEWVVAAADGTALYVHAVAEDGTGDREVGRISASPDPTGRVALWPMPSPDVALLVRTLSGGPVELRRSALSEAGGVTNDSIVSSVGFPGPHVIGTMGGARVMILDELTAGRPTGLYAIPATGAAMRLGPLDLGTSSLAYRGSMASRSDGSILVGRGGDGACGVMPVSSTGVPSTLASFPLTGTCSAPSLAELADGRIALVSGYDRLVVMVAAADLSGIDAMRDLGPLSLSGGEVLAAPDGSLRVVWPTATGVSTVALAGDAMLSPGTTTTLTTPGADGTDYAQVQTARHGRATAITYAAPNALMLTVVCD